MERHAELILDAAEAEFQTAMALAGANASRAVEAARAHIARESASAIAERERDRHISLIQVNVQEIQDATSKREGEIQSTAQHHIFELTKRVDVISAQTAE